VQQIIYNCGSYTHFGYFEFNVWSIGSSIQPSSYFMTITVKNGGAGGNVLFETSCELKPGQMSTAIIPNANQQPQFAPTPAPQPVDLEAMLAIFDRAIGLRKENGVWIPKVSEGDTVIIDKANSSDIKVLDPVEQAYERVPKRALIIEDGGCSCSMRQILMAGCSKLRGESTCAQT